MPSLAERPWPASAPLRLSTVRAAVQDDEPCFFFCSELPWSECNASDKCIAADEGSLLFKKSDSGFASMKFDALGTEDLACASPAEGFWTCPVFVLSCIEIID